MAAHYLPASHRLGIGGTGADGNSRFEHTGANHDCDAGAGSGAS
jgi:hypothetical protein